MAASAAQVLAPGAGWAVVICLAVGFSFLMLGLIFIQNRYFPALGKVDNDEFSSASRSIKPGLIACGIVSAWTWAATLQQSAAVAFKYGVSGPYAYAAGATIQVLLFAIIASSVKLNAPFANTYLQIIRARWGKVAHIMYTVFALITNVLVSSMLVLGGAATVNELTGMPTLAACFLTPIGIAGYVVIGGLRSSLIADYTHSAVLVCIILAFAITVYGTSDKIGSFSRMKELLDLAPPVEGNAAGSYLTMRSTSGLIFGVINVCGNFGTVFLDQSYFQRAVASKGETATKGFILGGIAWFAVPLTIASSLGLAARALMGQDPDMAILSADEISAGLPGPAAAAALLGKSGALMMLILLFLAVTSASAAQLVAVSSVFTFDIYQAYFRPSATAKELFRVSHMAVLGWAIIMGVLGLIWNYIGISLGWLYTFMGILIGAAVFPVAACMCWSRANRTAALVSTVIGLALAVTGWLVTTKATEGSLTITTTSANNPLLVGNLIAVFLPPLIMVPWTFMYPDNYDWESTRAVNAPWAQSTSFATGNATPSNDDSSEKGDLKSGSPSSSEPQALSKRGNEGSGNATADVEEYDRLAVLRESGLDPAKLIASRTLSIRAALVLTFVLLFFIPGMTVIPRTWTAAELGAWVSIGIAWMLVCGFIIILYPLWESREALGFVIKRIGMDIAGGKGKVTQ